MRTPAARRRTPTRTRGAFIPLLVAACGWSAAAAPLLGAQGPRGTRADSALLRHPVLAAERYLTPPPEIERLVTAPRHQNLTPGNPSPTGRHLLWVQTPPLSRSASFARPHDNLAGLQVDLRANRARSLTTRGSTALVVVDLSTGEQVPVQLPRGATASGAQWSPDGRQIAFLANFDDASYVYVAEATTGRARRVSGRPALATLVTAPRWTGDGKLVAVLVPERRMARPQPPAVASGPKVRLTRPGARNRTRTYADLLEWPHERELVAYHTTGQLALLEPRGGVRAVGAPAMVKAVSPSPDGRFMRVTLLQPPFSYAVQVSAFATVEQVWDMEGRVLAEVERTPLRERDGRDDGAERSDTTRRAVAWMPDGDGLYYLQQDPPARGGRTAGSDADSAGDGGRGPRRDRLVHWRAPFGAADARVLLESNTRITDVAFSEDGKLVAVAENVSGTGHVYVVALPEGKRTTLIRMRGLEASVASPPQRASARGTGPDDSTAFYGDPGRLMVRQTRGDAPVLVRSSDARHLFLEGTRYHPDPQRQAPRDFIDRVDVGTGARTRIFEGPEDVYEEVHWALDDDVTRVLVTRETATQVPDVYVRELGGRSLTRLSRNTDFATEISGAQRKRIPIRRADGYRFWVNVVLPRGHAAGTRLPALFWFYPYEYTDQQAYDRSKRTHNKHRFPTFGPRTMDYLVTQGYAVVQPDAPVFGPQGRMNDNYVSDLRNNLAAVIDELDRLGYIDRQQLALGGHSYGAFSTVNAMVHTPFFKAGIAGDGNYNRTLTPTTFQSERRDLWEARETYLAMSPLLYADRLTGALLMYHGLEDQNVGTAPINSERLFHALQGMGKTASLYMYPYEDHGPATRETLLDMWARWTAWLDRYVKGTGASDAEREPVAELP